MFNIAIYVMSGEKIKRREKVPFSIILKKAYINLSLNILKFSLKCKFLFNHVVFQYFVIYIIMEGHLD